MVNIRIKTKRVYSHGTDGMPKFEVINIALEDGAQFEKFLKYLPYKGYILDDLKVVEATANGEKIDTLKWQKRIDAKISEMGTVEETLHDKYEKEKRRNDDLESRLKELENLMSGEVKQLPKIEAKVESTEETDEISELREAYKEKYGKRPYNGWDIETLKLKLKD